ncbi:MAG TPA: hypothetical protein VFH03_06615 [Actinoplanes sp.]|nr:hypothetical protein [Actinoplanes sp.]
MAAGAVDGTATGPYALGWAAQETTGWIQLDWAVPQRLDRVVLYDRPGPDRVTAGMLTFSDGSTVRVGALPDTGSARVVTFRRAR